jgi:hypothetical protein
MTKCLSGYKFTKKQVARLCCNDCGVNVIEAGDFLMLKSAIWEGQFKLDWSDNLCLVCIEKRLRRHINFLDLSNPAWVDGYPMSDVLNDRLIGSATIKAVRAARARGKSVRAIARARGISEWMVRHCLRDRA